MKYVPGALAIGTIITVVGIVGSGTAWVLLVWPVYVTLSFLLLFSIDYWWSNR